MALTWFLLSFHKPECTEELFLAGSQESFKLHVQRSWYDTG